jgi:ubiquinone/menaquinone biosynthesis C-methylase UbiE
VSVVSSVAAQDRHPDLPARAVALTVVVPTTTTGEIERARSLVAQELPRLEVACQAIVVGAIPPQQRTSLEALGAEVIHTEDPSYGAALRAALPQALGAYAVIVDLSYPQPGSILRAMWEQREDAEVTTGSRYAIGSGLQSQRPWSSLLNRVYRRSLSLPARDVLCRFRMFKHEVLQDIGVPKGEGLEVLPEMLTKCVCGGWNVKEIVIRSRPDDHLPMSNRGGAALRHLKALARLIVERNSVGAADYDSRAFDSPIPLQRYWQRERFRIIKSFASKNSSVLDVGCGSSRIVQTMDGSVGLDIAISKLRWLRRSGRTVVQADMASLPFEDHSFEAVVCSEVIEHIPREQVRLDEMLRVIQPGGLFIVGTPDYDRFRWRALEWLYDRFFPNGYTSEHINPYTNASLRTELFQLGLDVLDCRYVGGGEMIFKARVPREPSRKKAHPAGRGSKKT